MDTFLLEKIEITQGSIAKRALLAHADNDTQKFLKWALDPSITFGVTIDEDIEVQAWVRTYPAGRGLSETFHQRWWDEFDALLYMLSQRTLTGLAAIRDVSVHIVGAPSDHACKWACRIINRNLRLGFDIKSFNKVFGKGSISKFEVQLAEQYNPEDELFGTWHFQPKLDGNRVIMIDGKSHE